MKWTFLRLSARRIRSGQPTPMWRAAMSFPLWLLSASAALPLAPPAAEAFEGDSFPDFWTAPTGVGVGSSDWQGIRAAHASWRHAFQRVGDGWEARNPGQQWTTACDGRGFLTRPQEGQWTWGLELQSYGFGTELRFTAGVPGIREEGQRLTYRWDDAVDEWFINDQRGLEHGFTVRQRPTWSGRAGGAELTFSLKIRDGLDSRIAADARSVSFHDASGMAVLHYAGLKVWDARGVVLPSRFETGIEPDGFRLLVDERGAHYPLTIDPVAQQAYLKPAAVGTTQVRDAFGAAVAISGDTVVVGAPGEDSSITGTIPNETTPASGAVYVFVRSGGEWTQQAFLKAGNNSSGGGFGESVAISGETIVVGRPRDSPTGAALSGSAYVFVRSAGVWTQEAVLRGSHAFYNQNFATSVAVSGDTIIAGVPADAHSATGVNGTPGLNGGLLTHAGAAYIFVRSGGVWTQQAWLKASNTGREDEFGMSVALSGDTAVVGAAREDSSTTGINGPSNELAEESGAAYVFVRNAGLWTQQAFLKAGNTSGGDNFARSVAASGDTIAVGAPVRGAVYIIGRSAGLWTQQALIKAPDNAGMDAFGTAISLSGNVLVAGVPDEDSSTTAINGPPDELSENSGAAYVFVRSGDAWTQQAFLKASSNGSGDSFGVAVGVSGDTAVVSAPGDDSSATGINSTPNNLATDAGAAYTFSGLGATPPVSPLEAWRQLHFGTTANTGNAANLFDADGDRLPNLVEYGFGLNPRSGASLQLPTVQLSGNSLTVTFPQPAGVGGITYGAQWSSSLHPGSWNTIPDTGNGGTHTFTVPAGAGGRVFLRLTVAEP